MVDISHLYKSYRLGNHDHTIFDDFNLTIPAGQLVVIFGPSGSGKSTLLNAVASIENYSGKIDKASDAHRIGYVSQRDSLFPWLSIKDNVAFGLKLRGMEKTRRLKIATDLLAEVGLSQYSDSYPSQLSGGLAQLASFARAIAYDANLMLMDEPFSSLDFLARGKLQEIVLRLHRSRGLTTLFVTHQIDEALYIGDRIVALSVDKPTRVLADMDVRGVHDKDSDAFYQYQHQLKKCYERI
jgi:NitT/TauT family transport system ATP-binding protein